MLIPSFLVSKVSESLRSLTKNERCEGIAQVAHQKLATMSDWLRGNERDSERIAHFWGNTSDSLGKLMSEFPALRRAHSFFSLYNAVHLQYEDRDGKILRGDQITNYCKLIYEVCHERY